MCLDIGFPEMSERAGACQASISTGPGRQGEPVSHASGKNWWIGPEGTQVGGEAGSFGASLTPHKLASFTDCLWVSRMDTQNGYGIA